MLRLLLLISFFVNFTYASGEKYFIQFGSFKDLRALEKNIERLPSSLRSHVVIVRSNSWYIPFAYYTSNKNALNSKVASYKRYFRDAHIAHSSYMLNHPLVRNYASTVAVKRAYIPPIRQYSQAVPKYQNVGISEEDNILRLVQPRVAVSPSIVSPIVTQRVVVKEIVSTDVFTNEKPKKHKKFSKQMLSGQHYYLAYKESKSNPNLLIKVTFGNHEVTYQPVIGEMKMTKASYVTEGGKLYMFTNTFTQNGSFSTLDEHRENHFLVSSWVKGKKLNTLRYYYKMNDAKEYLGIGTSTGLAEILSEGDYDDMFLGEE